MTKIATKPKNLRYAHCPSWQSSSKTRRVELSRDIVQAAIIQFPPGKAWKDAKQRLNCSWSDYSYTLLIRKNGEIWLGINAMWVTHAYECPPAIAKRLTSVVNLIDSWKGN